jgi:transposase-like protein
MSADWRIEYKKDAENHVTHLFCTHRLQQELYLAYLDLLCMDSTYNTNKYGMPMLQFMGVTPNGRYFPSSFCFMKSETEADFEWAIRNFKSIMNSPIAPSVMISDQDKQEKKACRTIYPDLPQMLCLFHFQMNITDHASKDWESLPASASDADREKDLERRQGVWREFTVLIESKTPAKYEQNRTALK